MSRKLPILELDQSGSRWSTKRYLNMQLLKQRDIEVQTA